MKQASHNKPTRKPIAIQMNHRIREGVFIISTAFALFLLLSFSSYHHTDPGWSSTGMGKTVLNLGGTAGAFLADLFLSIFGYLAYLLPPLFVFAAWIGIHRSESSSSETIKWDDFLLKAFGFICIVISGCGLLSLYLHVTLYFSLSAGGILGDIIVVGLKHILNVPGSTLFLITCFLCGATLFIGISWLGMIHIMGWYAKRMLSLLKPRWFQKPKEKPFVAQFVVKPSTPVAKPLPRVQAIEMTPLPKIDFMAAPKPKRIEQKNVPKLSSGMLPPLTLLNPPVHSESKAFSDVTLDELSRLVEVRLSDFGVEAKVVAVNPGPVITRFELELAPGIKVSKISGLSKDIARSLSVSSVRVVEVIPGKSVIGLELPNEHREIVSLREILESEHYAQSRSPVSLALGKDISGYPVVVDLAKMPHLLVAGTTGSGKSVSLNAMLLSMLFKATPEQLRIIMIDPKMLELSIYEGIPHLLTPVITDMKNAANALRWCVTEMDRRYRLMSMIGVRNIAGYNTKVTEAAKHGEPIRSPDWLMALGHHSPELQPLPMIVVVADELADMMMVVGKKVEELVTRIAQKARAAGIHLILATQRPSVDVITGLIKANVPTRIAFQVSSRVDSRTILDQQGAEQLLGHGDMLYLAPGTGLPVRVHGAYVGDEEVHRVVAAWQSAGKPDYLESVTETQDANGTPGMDEAEKNDVLYEEASRIVMESRRASISLVQRRLKIGYNRAARIMEELEAAGVVSQMDHSGSREVLVHPVPEKTESF